MVCRWKKGAKNKAMEKEDQGALKGIIFILACNPYSE